jgi:hypothetical protein
MLIGLDGFEDPNVTSLKLLKYSCMPQIVKPPLPVPATPNPVKPVNQTDPPTPNPVKPVNQTDPPTPNPVKPVNPTDPTSKDPKNTGQNGEQSKIQPPQD